MSSISSALNTALSALLVTEKQMSVASSNISNADVSGYTSKTTDIATAASGGVLVTGETSAVTQNLVRELSQATTDAGYADTVQSYYGTLDTYMGTLSGSSSSTTTTIASEISSLESDLSTLGQSPDSSTDQAQVLSDLDTLTGSLRDLSSQVQSLRKQADGDIASTVSDANSQLATINDLNKQIVAAKAQGQDTTNLEDSRNSAVVSLSSDLGVSYFVNSSGSMNVYTSSGQMLLSDSTVHTLSFTAAGSMSSSAVYKSDGSGTLSGVSVDGKDITASLTSGKLGAAITLRDSTLPAVQNELNTLTGSLVDAVNATYNQASANPPPTSLSGTTSVAASDSFSASGSVRVAVLDSSSDVVSYKDINLSTATSVSDVLNDLNGVSGVTAYLNASGDMVVASTDSADGVAINSMTSSVGSGSKGFSDYFGLNDLLTGDSASDVKVRSDLSSGTSTLATGVLSAASSLTIGKTGIASGDGSIATSLSAVLSATTTGFSASGTLGKQTTSFSGYASSIVSGIATAASTASSTATLKDTALSTQQTSFSNQTGVNTDTESALLTQLESQYTAAAKVIAIAQSMFQTLASAVAA